MVAGDSAVRPLSFGRNAGEDEDTARRGENELCGGWTGGWREALSLVTAWKLRLGATLLNRVGSDGRGLPSGARNQRDVSLIKDTPVAYLYLAAGDWDSGTFPAFRSRSPCLSGITTRRSPGPC